MDEKLTVQRQVWVGHGLVILIPEHEEHISPEGKVRMFIKAALHSVTVPRTKTDSGVVVVEGESNALISLASFISGACLEIQKYALMVGFNMFGARRIFKEEVEKGLAEQMRLIELFFQH